MTLEQAQSAMEVVARRLHAAYPDTWTDLHRQGRRITLLPESAVRVPPQFRGAALGLLALLMATGRHRAAHLLRQRPRSAARARIAALVALRAE